MYDQNRTGGRGLGNSTFLGHWAGVNVYIGIPASPFSYSRKRFTRPSVARRENATYEANHEEQMTSIRDALSAAGTAHEEAHSAAEARKEERAQKIRINDIEERAVLRLPFNDKTKELQALSERQQQVMLVRRDPTVLRYVNNWHYIPHLLLQQLKT